MPLWKGRGLPCCGLQMRRGEINKLEWSMLDQSGSPWFLWPWRVPARRRTFQGQRNTRSLGESNGEARMDGAGGGT